MGILKGYTRYTGAVRVIPEHASKDLITVAARLMAMKKPKHVDIQDVTRHIPWPTRLLLAVQAGGRCEFDGHNKFLYQDRVTKTAGNFAEFAHVIAFSAGGPRASTDLPAGKKNDISNLMLLCPTHHKLVDDDPATYTVAVLRAFKKRHEARVKHLTSIHPDSFTTVIVLTSKIGTETVRITREQVQEAIAPRYPGLDDFIEIDLTTIPSVGNPAFATAATAAIDAQIGRLFDARYDGAHISHLSVFALSTMPVLMYLGSKLTNKVPIDVFQRHRNTGNWTWKTRMPVLKFAATELRRGSGPAKVALLLSVSGRVRLEDLPSEIGPEFTIYEIKPESQDTSFRLIRTRKDLDAFASTYEDTLTHIQVNHPTLDTLHVFPAVPAPAAVIAGNAHMKRRHPDFIAYDYDKNAGGFTNPLRIS